MQDMLALTDSSDPTKFVHITPEGVNVGGAMSQSAVAIDLTLAQLLALPSAGMLVVPPPGPDKVILPDSFTLLLTAGAIPLAGGSDLVLYLGTPADPDDQYWISSIRFAGAAAQIADFIASAVSLHSATSMFTIGTCVYSPDDFTGPTSGAGSALGKGLYLATVFATPFTGGDADLKLRIVIRYRVEQILL